MRALDAAGRHARLGRESPGLHKAARQVLRRGVSRAGGHQHRGLAPHSDACEDLVRGHTMMITHREGRRVNAGKPRAAAFAGGQRATQGHERARDELKKALGAHQVRQRGPQVHQDVLRIIVRARSVVTPRKRDQERQHLPERQRRLTRPLALAGVEQAAVIDGLKGLAEIVTIAEESHQLIQRGSLMMQGGFVVKSAQHTGASCFFKVQPYPELTLSYRKWN